MEAVRLKLHIPPEKVEKRLVSAKTPLMEAASVGMNSALPYLIADAGAVLEDTYQTALTLTVESAQKDAFRFLVSFEAEVARLGPGVQAAFLGEPFPSQLNFIGEKTLDRITVLMAAAAMGRTTLLETLKGEIGKRDS